MPWSHAGDLGGCAGWEYRSQRIGGSGRLRFQGNGADVNRKSGEQKARPQFSTKVAPPPQNPAVFGQALLRRLDGAGAVMATPHAHAGTLLAPVERRPHMEEHI